MLLTFFLWLFLMGFFNSYKESWRKNYYKNNPQQQYFFLLFSDNEKRNLNTTGQKFQCYLKKKKRFKEHMNLMRNIELDNVAHKIHVFFPKICAIREWKRNRYRQV